MEWEIERRGSLTEEATEGHHELGDECVSHGGGGVLQRQACGDWWGKELEPRGTARLGLYLRWRWRIWEAQAGKSWQDLRVMKSLKLRQLERGAY